MRASFLAQGYNLAITAGLQFLTTPLLLTAWGVDNVGVWLVATSIAANAVLVELGYTYAAKTVMMISVAGGNRQGAATEFAAASLVVAFGNFACVAVAAIVFLCAPGFVNSLLSVAHPSSDLLIALALLLVNGLLQTHTLLLCAGQRAVAGPATEAAQSATIRLLEAAAMLAAASLWHQLAIAAAAMCGVRIAGNLLIYRTLRANDLVGTRVSAGAVRAVWRMAPGAVAYLMMPIAQALLIQFPVVVLGTLLTPREIVQYVAMRTIARIGTTLGNVVNNVAGPEYSIAYGAGNLGKVFGLLRKHGTLVAGLAVALAVAAWIGGSQAVMLLTRGHVDIAALPFTLLVAAVLVEICWTSLFTAVAALNKHSALAIRVLMAAAVSAAALYPFTSTYGMTGTAAVLLAGNLLALVAAFTVAQRTFGHQLRGSPMRPAT